MKAVLLGLTKVKWEGGTSYAKLLSVNGNGYLSKHEVDEIHFHIRCPEIVTPMEL